MKNNIQLDSNMNNNNKNTNNIISIKNKILMYMKVEFIIIHVFRLKIITVIIKIHSPL